MNPYSELIEKIEQSLLVLVTFQNAIRAEIVQLQQRQLNVLLLILISQWGIYFWHEASVPPAKNPPVSPAFEPNNRSLLL